MTIIYSNHFKRKLAVEGINLGTDTIRACLVRDNFVFSPDFYAVYKNISAIAGPTPLTFSAGGQSITRTSGSFLTDGFVPGNRIVTTLSSNPGPFTVTNVTAQQITVLGGIASAIGVASVTCVDELETGYGYGRGGRVLTGVILTKNDTNNTVEFTCSDILWIAEGGNIGPISGIILYDDTSDDDTIICYIDLGGDYTIANGQSIIVNPMLEVSGTGSNHAKLRLAEQHINLETNVIKLLLMRSGFVFHPIRHARMRNLRTTSGSIEVTFTESNQRITRDSGSFRDNGFVIGNRITTNSALNPGPFIISDVSDLYITVTSGVVDEGPVTRTITSDDELPTGSGYTQDSIVLSNKAVVRDNTNDWAQMSCDTVNIYALGGTIGPTPGFILYDDTDAQNTIIGFFGFGEERTALAGDRFLLSNIRIRFV